MASMVDEDAPSGWGEIVNELLASQDSEVSLCEEAEACRSETDVSDSLPDPSLWWVNKVKQHLSGNQRPPPPKTPRDLLSGCTASGADIMVMKA
eukprot:s3938_g7.t1